MRCLGLKAGEHLNGVETPQTSHPSKCLRRLYAGCVLIMSLRGLCISSQNAIMQVSYSVFQVSKLRFRHEKGRSKLSQKEADKPYGHCFVQDSGPLLSTAFRTTAQPPPLHTHP